LIILATDYLTQLNKEKQQLSIQLEAKKKDNFCLRAVQKFELFFFVFVIFIFNKIFFLERTKIFLK
jgi:hypothetical protein